MSTDEKAPGSISLMGDPYWVREPRRVPYWLFRDRARTQVMHDSDAVRLHLQELSVHDTYLLTDEDVALLERVGVPCDPPLASPAGKPARDRMAAMLSESGPVALGDLSVPDILAALGARPADPEWPTASMPSAMLKKLMEHRGTVVLDADLPKCVLRSAYRELRKLGWNVERETDECGRSGYVLR